jgi:hypothetical protein
MTYTEKNIYNQTHLDSVKNLVSDGITNIEKMLHKILCEESLSEELIENLKKNEFRRELEIFIIELIKLYSEDNGLDCSNICTISSEVELYKILEQGCEIYIEKSYEATESKNKPNKLFILFVLAVIHQSKEE